MPKQTKEKKLPRPWAMTPVMRAAIQPFLKKLLTRYRQVARDGETEIADPLCKAAGAMACPACPVFGVACLPQIRNTSGYVAVCEDYFPLRPSCVEDQDGYVTSGGDKLTSAQKRHGTPSSREQGRRWGAEVVLWLEAMQTTEADL